MMKEFLSRISELSPKRLALLAVELQSKLEALEQARKEPIAIIGLGCRFPGGATNPEKFWQLLQDGVDAITEIPASRWDIDRYYDPDPNAPGKMSTRWGGFLAEVDKFDAQFFGIAPREATTMDPQQRLLLEVSWEALEHAGQSADRLVNSSTGVFIGLSGGDYYHLQLGSNYEDIDAYLASGSAHSIASGRLSYILGLRGPSISIDTACSSSLAAIHLAVQSLRNNECRMALAGGVNLILSPETTITLSKAHMMAPDGRCKTFDARANGFVRSEGCGMVVLKRLTDAVSDGDNILAVIRGTAMNQDGRSNGLTAPNGPSQEAVIREALANANLEPSQISYVETHGTGTSLGDPIEVHALAAALGQNRPTHNPLVIGSVKTNIGHLEAAAGVAALIKVVLSLQHAQIPAHLHLQERNPYISWERCPLTIPTRPMPWPAINERRLAGVSSFGFSGTNIHLIVEAAPDQASSLSQPETERPLHILTLSAKSDQALKEQIAQFEHHLAANPESLPNLAYTMNTGRAHFSHRLALISESSDQAQAKLAALSAGQETSGVWTGEIQDARQPGVAFLFTGQGSQYVAMGQQLYQTQPIFRQVLDQCQELLRPYLERPLLSVLYPEQADAGLLDQTAYTQPALFALEYALAALWQSWGVKPGVVMGHSVGEYVAACVAGLFNLEDGLKLIAERGRLMQQLPLNGEMAAIFAAEGQVTRAIAPYANRVAIAALNGPEHVVISGERSAIGAVLNQLESQGIQSRRLNVSHAFHSPLMEPVLDAFEKTTRTITFLPSKIGLISNVTGQLAPQTQIAQPGYWRRHIREAVRFTDSMATLQTLGYRVFIEIGPSPTLISLGQRCLSTEQAADYVWTPSLRKGRTDWSQMLESLAQLYVRGVEVDWLNFERDSARRRLILPTYPFQREKYWIKTTPGQLRAAAPVSEKARHPLLGGRLSTASAKEIIFESQVSANLFPFLEDHRIHGVLVLPSPVYMEMALAAAARMFDTQACSLKDMVIHEALILAEEKVRILQFILTRESEKVASFQIYSLNEGETWRLHASGQLQVADIDTLPIEQGVESLAALQARCQESIDVSRYYSEDLSKLGLEFGPRFQGIKQIWRRNGEALGWMQLPEPLTGETSAYTRLHPALLDACFHLVGAALPNAGHTLSDAYLLLGLDQIEFFGKLGGQFWAYARLKSDENQQSITQKETFTGDIDLYGEDNQLVARFSGLHFKKAKPATLLRLLPDQIGDLLYEAAWMAKPHPAQETAADGLFALEPIVEHIQAQIAELSARNGLELYTEMQPQLDKLCADYILHAFRKLGWNFDLGQQVTLTRLVAQLGIVNRHQRLVGRLLEILTEEGILKSLDHNTWQVCRKPEAVTPSIHWTALCEKYPMFEAEFNLTGRCAEQLAEVLQGQADPLQLLFPGGSLAEAEKLYRDSAAARVYNTLIQETITAAVAQLSQKKTVRILEIGAGTGGTTSYILPHLPAGQVEYVFTDVSPLFGTKAKQKFGQYPFVQYKTLDIGRNPEEQGFEKYQFDLIVAANVLHATADLRQTVTHVQQLLAPNGLLVLLEGTAPQRYGDLTVGLTDGWWAFSDTDLRPAYALMPRQRWLNLLREVGFTETVAIPGENSQGVMDQQAVIVARGPQAFSKTEAGCWLIFADEGGVGQQLAQRFEMSGEQYLTVTPGDSYRPVDQHHVTINPANPADFRQLLGNGIGKLCRGVIYLWALDASLTEETTPAELETSQFKVCGSVLHLVQALLTAGWAKLPDFWLVTRGSQSVQEIGLNDGFLPVAPAQAPIWGLSNAIRLEHPELHCINIDLDPVIEKENNLELLFTEILQPDKGEDQIAFRHQARLARRLVRHSHKTGRQNGAALLQFQADGSYLITGGLAGLGLLTAQWLVEHGARHLTLMGRRQPTAAAQAIIAQLEQAGTKILVAQGDVSKKEQVETVLTQIQEVMPPLRGVIHAAGVLDDGVLLQQNWDRFSTVMAAKVTGTWHLHTLTRHQPLDFFVLYSSGASLVGSAGQGNHAAANAFMDSLAHYRRTQGLPAVSINWGAWAKVGAAAERKLDERGVDTMTPEEGLQALERILQQTTTDSLSQIGVLPVNWVHFFQQFAPGSEPALFAELVRESRKSQSHAQVQMKVAAKEPELLQQWVAALPNKRPSILRTHVREQAAKVLGIEAAQLVNLHQPLHELGLDSLMAVELRNNLGKAVNQTLPATLLFEHPTLNSLVNYLAEEVLKGEPAPTATAKPVEAEPKPAESSEQITADLDDLSEDEMAALLMQKLAEIE